MKQKILLSIYCLSLSASATTWKDRAVEWFASSRPVVSLAEKVASKREPVVLLSQFSRRDYAKMAGIGLAAGIVGGLGVNAITRWCLDRPVQHHPCAEPALDDAAATLQALTDRIAQLENRSEAVQGEVPADMAETLRALTDRIAQLESRPESEQGEVPADMAENLQALTDRIAQLENRPESVQGEEPADMAGTLQALTDRIAQLENHSESVQGEVSADMAEALQALTARIAQLENRPVGESIDVAAIVERLAALESRPADGVVAIQSLPEMQQVEELLKPFIARLETLESSFDASAIGELRTEFEQKFAEIELALEAKADRKGASGYDALLQGFRTFRSYLCAVMEYHKLTDNTLEIKDEEFSKLFRSYFKKSKTQQQPEPSKN